MWFAWRYSQIGWAIYPCWDLLVEIKKVYAHEDDESYAQRCSQNTLPCEWPSWSVHGIDRELLANDHDAGLDEKQRIKFES